MSVQVQTLSDQVYYLVRQKILSLEIAPGAAVRQDAIARTLNVSKIPLREAFVRLEQDGLLVNHANRGFYVKALSATESAEVFDLRLRLEPVALALCARHASDAERQGVQRAFEAMTAQKVTDEPDYEAQACALNRAFHLSLIQLERAPIAYQIIERLHLVSERYVLAHRLEADPKARKNEQARSGVEHLELLSAYMGREAEKCASLCYAHIAATREQLKKAN